ncbi:MAG TPA: FecR domain-containing protein [Anaeromyxobacteraceae bacterium]
MKRRGDASLARLILAALAVAALVSGAAWLVFQRTLGREGPAAASVPAPPPAAPPAPPAPPVERTARVVAVTGTVESGRGEGPWTPLRGGESLGQDESVRAGPGSGADIAVGDRARLTVAERTQLSVEELTEAVHRFRLKRGRVAADYRPDGARVLRIESGAGDAFAEAASARFSALSSGDTLAVATETGAVNLRAAGAAVQVGAGEVALARPGEAPSAPAAVPAAVLLKVVDAGRVASASLCAAVEGRVQPGSEVSVDGEPVEVGADGSFAARLRRRPGLEQVRVAARDPLGRTAERKVSCRKERWERIDDFAVRWKNARGR